MVVRVTMKDGRLSSAPGARTVTVTQEDYDRLLREEAKREAFDRQLDEVEAFRPRSYIRFQAFFSMLPYVAIAVGIVLALFFFAWLGVMADEDCKDKGGARRVRSGRYTTLCVTDDGRIVE